MAQKKKKIEVINNPYKMKVPDTRDISKPVEGTQQESEALIELWKHEVSELECKEFATMQEALDVIIEKVLDRFGSNITSREETHKFLSDLLSTDPGLQEELFGILKIKDR